MKFALLVATVAANNLVLINLDSGVSLQNLMQNEGITVSQQTMGNSVAPATTTVSASKSDNSGVNKLLDQLGGAMKKAGDKADAIPADDKNVGTTAASKKGAVQAIKVTAAAVVLSMFAMA